MRHVIVPFLLALLALLPPVGASAAPQVIDVWPGLAPGEQTRDVGHVQDQKGGVTRLTNITRPRMLFFPATGPGPHPTVLVCPGGGYQFLSVNSEGTDVARWMNGLGLSAAVLQYRVPNEREGALQDGQRALSLLRARAGELRIDPQRLGVLGFSAGGHLSARLAAGYETRAYTPVDASDAVSDRPDFALLIYPAYLLDKGTTQPAPEVTPHAGMPPVFLTQTLDDPYLDAPEYGAALEKAGIPMHCVLYDKGGHGYGLRLPADQPAHHWPDEAAAWLRQQVSPTGSSEDTAKPPVHN